MNTNFTDKSLLEYADLSVRTSNVLRMANIKTIEELCTKTSVDLLDYHSFGLKSLKEVRSFLRSMNRCLKDDIIIENKEMKEFLLSIPITINEMHDKIKGLIKTLRNIDIQLEHMKSSLEKQ